MTRLILQKVLERVAEAALRDGIYSHQRIAYEVLLNEKPKKHIDSMRAATIEAIAVKGLDPNQSTEDIFRKALAFYLEDPDANGADRALPGMFDRIVSDSVRAAIEERLLGKRTSSERSL